jgi:hypothetical protein
MSFHNRENAHATEKNDDFSGMKSIYMILIIIMYNERADLFKKPTTPHSPSARICFLIFFLPNFLNHHEMSMDGRQKTIKWCGIYYFADEVLSRRVILEVCMKSPSPPRFVDPNVFSQIPVLFDEANHLLLLI